MTTQVDEKLEDLYELIHRYCNLEPVKDLLRDFKADESVPEEKRDDVRITGEKRVIVTENLRKAVDNGTIPIGNVLALLQEAEENGAQHIFLFRASSSTAKESLNDSVSISEALLGKNWRNSKRYPRLQLKPDGFCWSDFRSTPRGGWIAKLYGHAMLEEATDEKPIPGERARWVKLEMKDVRDVCVVRWRPEENLLELRVSSKRSKILLEELKDRLGVVLEVDELCTPWDLSPVRQRLFKDAGINALLYECGAWHSVDGENYALSGVPHLQNPDESVFLSERMQRLVSEVAESDELEKIRLVVVWKPSDDNDRKTNLRTVIGTQANTHEVIIAAKASSRAIDDVLDQLLRFEE